MAAEGVVVDVAAEGEVVEGTRTAVRMPRSICGGRVLSECGEGRSDGRLHDHRHLSEAFHGSMVTE